MAAVDKALIIGGGIGGLTVAAALQQKGVSTRVVEIGRRSDRLGTGISLLGNALRALDRIGLAEKCIEAGAGFDKVINLDAEGNLLNELVPARTFKQDRPGAFGIMRPVLSQILEAGAVTAGATIDFETKADRITMSPDGSVAVWLSTGEFVETPLLIAADGAYSKVRQLIFGDGYVPVYSGQGVWRYTAPRSKKMEGIVFYRAADGAVLGGIPIAPKLCYYFVLENAAVRPRFPEDRLWEMFRARMEPFTAPEVREAAALIDQNSVVSYRPLDALLMPEPWYKDRVVLLGDAAHSLTPQLTSGGGMAIEDAVVLAEELDRHPDVASALAAYSARRAPRVKAIFDTSYGICVSEQNPLEDKELSMRLLSKGHQLLAQPF